MKNSEELQMNAMLKNTKQISKKEARCFIQRLKLFSQIILNNKNDQKPLVELVQLCHDILSQSEYLIFENQSAPQDLGQQMSGGYMFGQQLATDPN